MWELAERLAAAADPDDRYIVGIVMAFRWLARRSTLTPVTRTLLTAMPEALDAELRAAQVFITQPGHHPLRVDRARGVAAALSWAWNNGPLPVLLATE